MLHAVFRLHKTTKFPAALQREQNILAHLHIKIQHVHLITAKSRHKKQDNRLLT